MSDLILLKTTYKDFKLCGPLGEISTCKLEFSRKRHSIYKFGDGWKTFYQLNNIQADNHLIFKLPEYLENNVIVVNYYYRP
jgi:hypothetical protein